MSSGPQEHGPQEHAPAHPAPPHPAPPRPAPPRPRTPEPDGVAADRERATAARLASVLPAPTSVRPAPGERYQLTADTAVRTGGGPAADTVGNYLAELLRPATGYPLPVSALDGDTPPPDTITLLLEPTANPDEAQAGRPAGTRSDEEGYRLDVTGDGVVVRARTRAGLLHGVQTLRQLLPVEVESDEVRPGPWLVPGGQIVDAPRFAYRGAMLDVARHFFGVPDVLRLVDQLARYKLNHLHLHLTDDQGWRIAIDSWPKLAEIGGATEVDGGAGGHYTQDDYRTIVAYAQDRGVTVVPEIDLPGHTNAALSAYGELAPDGIAPPPYTGTEVGFSYVAVHSERTYDFVDDVLGELAALTPGAYLHVGGDEAYKVNPEDYNTVMSRVQRIAAGKGKTVVGWHQLAPVEHLPGRVLQYWGTAAADEKVSEAVARGARVIMSPGNRTYLDMKYDDATPLGLDWAGLIEVRTAYDWDPGSSLDGVPEEAVLGIEAPLWTETIRTVAEVEYMTFPRLVAVAELGWSTEAARDWESFRLRLAAHAPRWDLAGIAYHPSPEVPWPSTAAGHPTVPAPRRELAPADTPTTGIPIGDAPTVTSQPGTP
ncbi:beta-N-acetylhexosaminidase [Micromonospora sp. NPDC050397]|uniref:beta-N-acetylhexosaminidase n=1 Tax=Micromonospora sp. NPDC050397 TaxID=3364279 RepID=UPI00384E26F1